MVSRDELGLGNPYDKAKKNIKKAGKGIKRFLGLFIVIGIIVILYVINIACGGLVEVRKPIIADNIALKGDKINIELDKNHDPDTDGLTTGEELEIGTNPFNRDTDNDGVTDDGEINLGLNPLVADENILVDAYNGIVNEGLSFKYGNFTLQADDIKSRAYVSAVEEVLPSGNVKTTFDHFSGIIKGDAFHQENGFSKKVSQIKSKGDKEIFITGENLETITTFNTFGNVHLIENGFLRGLLNFIFPQKGLISAFDNLKSDYDILIINNFFDEGAMQFAINSTKNLSNERFNLLHIDPSYKDKLTLRLKNGEVVPISIISDDIEYILYITGQYNDGNFAVYDKDGNTAKLILEKASRPLTDGNNFVQMEYLRFEIGDLSSDNGRLIFL